MLIEKRDAGLGVREFANKFVRKPARVSRVFGCAATSVTLLLAGCGLGPGVTPDSVSNALIGGHVHGGQQPVTQSHIALFATTSAGYGGTLTPLATAQTDATGSFTITGSYTCPSTQQAYIVATGGNPGAASGTDNSAIFLMAALGPCSGIGSSTTVDINEVTTVAAAYALSGFAPVGGAGLTEAAVVAGTAMAGITTSSANTQGLMDGFANANNIVNTLTGLAYTATPVTASGGIVPQSIIHALADILQPCVNSTTPASTACVNLFAAATPPATFAVAAPVNVFQAALNIARYPGNNVSTLYSLISTTPAFATSLSAAPNDWTIGIVYPNSQINNALAMAVDGSDNVWVASSYNAELLEFNPQGLAISPTTTSGPPSGAPSGTPAQSGWAQGLYVTSSKGDNIRSIAFDPSGNLWLSDGVQSAGSTGLYEYTPGGTPTAPTQGTIVNRSYTAVNTDYNNYFVAADKYGDVFTTSYKKSTCASGTASSNTLACNLVEFVPTAYTAYDTFGTGPYSAQSPDANGARGLAVDSNTGNIWYTDIGSANVGLFKTTLVSGSAATATANASAVSLGTTDTTYGVAIDKNANAWVVGTVTGGLYEISSAGALVGTEAVNAGLTSTASAAYNIIDGNNNVFVANPGASTPATSAIVEYSIAASSYLSPNFGFSPSATYVPVNGSTPASYSGAILYRSSYIAVDRSGALWALGSGAYSASNYNSALVQILGVAAPTDPVLADGKFGVKP